MSSSSDSECDGEETKRIKAAAVDFSDIVKNSAGKSNVISFCEQPFLGGLNSDYTNVNKASISTRDGHLKQNLTSKRPDKVREQEPEHELQTTPEFRSFVAKKLAAIIDSSIKVKRRWTDESAVEDSISGIQLFSSSEPISDIKNEVSFRRGKSKNKPKPTDLSSSSDSSGDETMFASVAVSGELIISQGLIRRLDQEQTKANSQTQEVDKISQNSTTDYKVSGQDCNKLYQEYATDKSQKKRKYHIEDS